MNERLLRSVTRLKCFPINRCCHFLNASTIAYVSFLIAECFCSVSDNVLALKATGRPFWLSVAAIAKFDSSVSTVNGMDISTRCNDAQASWFLRYELFNLHHQAAALLFALQVELFQSSWESTCINHCVKFTIWLKSMHILFLSFPWSTIKG